MDLQEIGYEGVDGFALVHGRVKWWGGCEHGSELWDYIKCGDFLII
jgi:hypothetical protein